MNIKNNFPNLNPYIWELETANTFGFTTDYELYYRVYFQEEGAGWFENYPNIKTYIDLCGFDKTDSELPVKMHDKRIADTIISIIQHWFGQKPKNALFWINDKADGKQHGRKKLFEKWFGKLQKNGVAKHYVKEFFSGRDTYIGVIYHENSLYISELQNAVTVLVQDF